MECKETPLKKAQQRTRPGKTRQRLAQTPRQAEWPPQEAQIHPTQGLHTVTNRTLEPTGKR